MAENAVQKREYKAPKLLPLGKASELTLGNGEVHVDFLGNPLTKYGKWGETKISSTE